MMWNNLKSKLKSKCHSLLLDAPVMGIIGMAITYYLSDLAFVIFVIIACAGFITYALGGKGVNQDD